MDVIKEPICILMQVWQFLEVRIPRGAASNPLYHGPIGSSTLMAWAQNWSDSENNLYLTFLRVK